MLNEHHWLQKLPIWANRNRHLSWLRLHLQLVLILLALSMFPPTPIQFFIHPSIQDSLTHLSLVNLLSHSAIHLLVHSATHWLTHLPIHVPIHSSIHSSTNHSITHPLIHSLNHSLSHVVTYSCCDSLTGSFLLFIHSILTHPLIHSAAFQCLAGQARVPTGDKDGKEAVPALRWPTV